MNTFADILTFIIDSIGGLFLIFVVLRFLLQLARADFYNPFSQAVVKITTPLLKPLRTFIPGVFGIDIASIVLAILVQFVVAESNAFVIQQAFVNPLLVLSWAVLGTLKLVTNVFFVCIIIMVISSFVAPHSRHPAIMLAVQLVSPITRPIQKFIPPMGGLDFSVFFIGMALVIIQKVLDSFATSSPFVQLVIGY